MSEVSVTTHGSVTTIELDEATKRSLTINSDARREIAAALDDVAAWHEAQAKYYEPFGANNALVEFHKPAAIALRKAAVFLRG